MGPQVRRTRASAALGDAQADRGEDAVAVFGDCLGEADEWVEAAAGSGQVSRRWIESASAGLGRGRDMTRPERASQRAADELMPSAIRIGLAAGAACRNRRRSRLLRNAPRRTPSTRFVRGGVR